MNTTLFSDYSNIIYDAHSCPELDYLDVREYVSDIVRRLISKLGDSFNNFYFLLFDQAAHPL